MLEHLSRADARRFLGECRRVLAPDGIIRIAVPDLRMIVLEYGVEQDGDRLIQRLMLADERRGIQRVIRFTGHRWMYDGESLRRTLTEAGFCDAEVLGAGFTRIPDPGHLNLREREDESVYVEARR
jgi:predicted SAM-dependent methyltransferase